MNKQIEIQIRDEILNGYNNIIINKYYDDEDQVLLDENNYKDIIDNYEYINIFTISNMLISYKMSDEFKKIIKNNNNISILNIKKGFQLALPEKNIDLESDISYSDNKTVGGKKGGVKYTVKQLQAIASKNNIKITKKVDGKTVRLNKKGLMTKLKRYKLI
jgi:hypothetical protein